MYEALRNSQVDLPPGWVYHPQEIERLLRQWETEHGDLLRLEAERQFCGLNVWAATVTGPGDATNRPKMLCIVPHAHEPGGTAASMEFLSQLITGRSLADEPGSIPRERYLAEAEITLIPAGNPDGLRRSPLPAWDGTVVDNEEFWRVMKGLGPDGASQLAWLPELDAVATEAKAVGIVYEQTGPTTYVEPNRSQGGALWRLVDRLADGCPYRQFLNLHQGMEAWADKDTWLEYPTDDWLPAAAQEYCLGWSEAVLDALEAVGAKPERKTGHYETYRHTPGWSEDGRRLPWIIDWLTLKSGTSELTVEVQNNNPRTPAAKQRLFALTAIVAGVEYLPAHP